MAKYVHPCSLVKAQSDILLEQRFKRLLAKSDIVTVAERICRLPNVEDRRRVAKWLVRAM